MLRIPTPAAEVQHVGVRLTIPTHHGSTEHIGWKKETIFRVTSSPKLVWHPGGLIQASGPGVRSGLEIDGTPKGLGIVSYKLDASDMLPGGGYRRIFTAFLWGLDDISSTPACDNKARMLTLTPNVVTGFDNDTPVSIEGFLLPSSALLRIDPLTRHIRFQHPGLGVIRLTFVSCVGDGSLVFALMSYRSTKSGFKSSHGYTLGIGPGLPMTADDGRPGYEQIFLTYNAVPEIGEDYRTLDYQP